MVPFRYGMRFRLLRDSFTQITFPHTLKQLTMRRLPRTMSTTMLITDSKIRGANGLIGFVTGSASMLSPVLSMVTFLQTSSVVHRNWKVANCLSRFVYGGPASGQG